MGAVQGSHQGGRHRRLGVSDVGMAAAPGQVSISHDGEHIAYDVSSPDVLSDKNTSSIWIAAVGAGVTASKRLTTGSQDSHPVFAPLGHEVAFLRSIDGTAQLFRGSLDDVVASQITHADRFPWGVRNASWSPDGQRFALTAEVARSGSVPGGRRPIVVDRLDCLDGTKGYLADRRSQVFVVNTDGSGVRQITDDVGGAGRPSWSPDGRLLAFTLEVGERPDLTGHRAAHIADPDDHTASPRRVGTVEYLAEPLLWVDHGRSLVAVGLPEFDVAPAQLYVLSVDGSEPDRAVTEEFDRTVMVGATGYPGSAPAQHPDGRHVIFCARNRGQTNIFQVPLVGGEVVRILEAGVHVVSSLSVASEAPFAAAVITTGASFGEVVRLDLATNQHTTIAVPSGRALEDVEVLLPELREFRVNAETVVDAWVLRAPGTKGAGPLLLDIHGGPHNAWSGVLDAAHLYQQELANSGWTIVMPNPPGSDGYGKAFYRAVLGKWGTADAPSLLAIVDELVADGTADAARLAVTGYSYGGFAVCHLTSTTDRFAAAVAGGLICDYANFGASSDEGGLFGEVELGGSPTSDRARLMAASPISRVDAVTTPTLVLHGRDDHTCPLGQAEQWYTALARKQVRTALVAYPGASHLFIVDGRPSHRIDYQQRVLAWLTRHTLDLSATGERPTSHWQARLDTVIDRCGIPGAQLGILELDARGTTASTITVAAGVLHHGSGARTMIDSVFQIGSISKIWTAVLVMQLVDEGLLDLDARVIDILGVRVAKDEAATEVTVRQLLDHTSGIDGDRFDDFGSGEASIAAYVEALADTALVHPPGRGWSYCNAGWVVAGRIVEHLRVMTWDEAVRRFVIQPLGLRHSVLLPEEALLHSAALGHKWDASGEAPPVGSWGLTRALGPAGLVSASIGDLLTFAGTLMREGSIAAGGRLLSGESTRAMRTPSIDVTGLAGPITSWGLGWFIENWSGETVFGHDGSTIGQRAYLRIFPERGLAVALLTNGGHSDRAYQDLFTEISIAAGGPPVPTRPVPDPSADPFDVERFIGSYRTAAARVQIESNGAGLTATIHEFGEPGAEDDGPENYVLHPSGPGTFVARLPDSAFWQEFGFHLDEDGKTFLQHSKRRMVRE